MEEKKHFKIAFRLLRDEDGYPPDDVETLWAWEMKNGSYCIDNIPFFVKGISPGDVVSAKEEGGELCFTSLLQPSANSVFRIYVTDESKVQSIRDELRKLNYESELSHIPNLIAVEIRGDASIEPFLDFIMEGAENKQLDYQEAALRHAL